MLEGLRTKLFLRYRVFRERQEIARLLERFLQEPLTVKELLGFRDIVHPSQEEILADHKAVQLMLHSHGWAVFHQAAWRVARSLLQDSLNAKTQEEREANRAGAVVALKILRLPNDLANLASRLEVKKDLLDALSSI